jgi:hypothetical protein
VQFLCIAAQKITQMLRTFWNWRRGWAYQVLRQINRLRTGENMEDIAVQALKIRVSVVQLRPWAPSN